MTSTDHDVLLIDGYCGFCSRMGRFLEKRISKSTPLKIVGQESDEGLMIISKLDKEIQNIDSVLLIRDGRVFYYSSAAIRCVLYLKWWWKVLYPAAWLIPLPIRNFGYTIISKNRKRLVKSTN